MLLSRLSPARLPVRWRLALGSAGLTLAIVVVFAISVGRLASDRLREDFRSEVRNGAGELALQISISRSRGLGLAFHGPRLDDYASPNDAAIRVVGANGTVLAQSDGAPDLGPAVPGVTRARGFQIATAPVLRASLSDPPRAQPFAEPLAYVQYARSAEDVESTISRLWLFLGAGVLGATALAMLAGLMVSDRAMRPISSLTAKAREIAETRDPSRRLPQPEADDEVAELARTLQHMLEELDKARADTQGAMQRQREFVADASHELRTPLTSILANLELLEAALSGEADAEERAMVSSALRSSQRMRRLVSDLLLLARADAGRLGQRDLCDLAEIAAGAVQEAEPVAAERTIQLAVNGPAPVWGSHDELHRMVANLVDNAVRHTADGTGIAVSVTLANGMTRLTVDDEGPGLAGDLRDQIFDRFVRGGGDAGRGTGLGLAIVKAVAEAHGGTVTAQDSPGGGARFEVRLPEARPEPVAPVEETFRDVSGAR